jgi:YbgC/YbaW family acyl-CoA thioester hydrolase
VKHVCSLSVRSYECDVYNHVNNAVYLNYLEFARMEFLKDLGFDYQKLISDGFGLLVARIAIDYKQPAYVYDLLEITTVPVKRRRTFGIFSQSISREDDVIAQAEVTWVSVNKAGKPVPLPEEFEIAGLSPDPA